MFDKNVFDVFSPICNRYSRTLVPIICMNFDEIKNCEKFVLVLDIL